MSPTPLPAAGLVAEPLVAPPDPTHHLVDRSIALLLGVPIDILTMSDALERVTDLVQHGRADGRTHQVVTVNVDFLVNARADAQLRSILRRSDLAIADGMPLVWASRLFGRPLPERVAGVDLVSLLAERSAREGFSMLLFGGRPGVADQAAARLAERHPGLAVSGMECPEIGSDGSCEPGVVDAARAAGADVVCVALGHPKQDKWIDAHRHRVGAPLLIGVGGTLDFIAGITARAPAQMQRSGLEWLHRLAHDPGRLGRRYSRDLVQFAPRIAAQRLGAPAQSLRAARPVHALDALEVSVWTPSTDAPVTTTWAAATSSPLPRDPMVIVLDLRALATPSWQGLASVVGLARRLRPHGSELIAVGGAVTRAGRWWGQHLDGHITIYPDTESASQGARRRMRQAQAARAMP